MKTKNVLKLREPHYYNGFRCSPNLCKETCCSHWRILVDESTYHSYMGSFDPTIKSIAKESLSPNPSPLGFEDYGIIALNQQFNCPFLEVTGLCQVVTRLGEKHLSMTCKQYPRAINCVGDTIEVSLETSCSVAAEAVLFSEQGLRFLEVKRQLNHSEVLVTASSQEDQDGIEFSKQVRDSVIELLQLRKYSLTQRIILVGYFLKTVENESSITLDAVNKDLYTTIQWAKNAAVSRLMGRSPAVVGSKSCQPFNHFNTLLALRFSKQDGSTLLSKVYMGCLSEVLNAFGRVNSKKLEDAYKEGYTRYLLPYLKEREIVIENFMVNTSFVYGYRYFKKNLLLGAFKKLFTVYGLVQFNLVGMAIFKKGMKDSEVHRLIHSFSKIILSDPSYLESICTQYDKINLHDVEDLVGLLL